MKAGPELDAQIAKEVMELDVLGFALCLPEPGEPSGYGVPFQDIVSEHFVERPVYLVDCACEFRWPLDIEYFGHFAGCLGVAPDYSKNIAAAWQAVERLTEGVSPHCNLRVERLGDEGWRASMCFDDWENMWSGWAYADTAPHAICLAALKAVGVEYEER
jgi:hypothetical protein